MDDELSVRAGEFRDILAIQAVARSAWAATYAEIIPDDVQRQLLGEWYSAPALERALRAEDSIVLVATSQQTVLGFAHFVRRSDESAELTRIYVLPAEHNRSIGSRLLEAGVTRLKTLGVGRLTVAVEQKNAVGRRFFQRKGFSEVSQRRIDLQGHALALVECHRPI